MRISTDPTASRYCGALQITLDASDAALEYSSPTGVKTFPYIILKNAVVTHGVIWHGLKLTFVGEDQEPLYVNGLTLDDANRMINVIQEKRADAIVPNLVAQADEALRASEALSKSDGYVDDFKTASWRNTYLSFPNLLPPDFFKLPIEGESKAKINKILNLLKEKKLREHIDQRNNRFVNEEMTRWKEFFDGVERYPLTLQQREAIVRDESNNLIIAGAGTGKTSTLMGKVGYILKKGLATSDEILLLAFAKDAAKELQERIREKFSQEIEVRTFHSFGMQVISQARLKPSVSKLATDEKAQEQFILESLSELLKNVTFSKRLSEFFRDYLKLFRSRFSFDSLGEYFDYLRTYDVRTLKGEKVKSYEECMIANYLALSGIRYEYERPYKHPVATKDRAQYKPDFYLLDFDIYIEHFAINKQYQPPSFFSEEERIRYVQDMEWKRKLHAEKETRLVETFSYEADEGDLISNLEKKLTNAGVIFKPISPEELFRLAISAGYVNRMTSLLGTFIRLFKASQMAVPELYEKAEKMPDRRRVMAFLQLFEKIHERYQAYLIRTGEIDFNDMIGSATELIRNRVYISPFKYILIDEFQDISISRFRLVKALLDQNPSQKVVCVGDDWQSIYRFSGSDLSVMVEFEKYFGFARISKLEKTFRFKRGIMNFSTKFILRNPKQIRKELTCDEEWEKKPVKIIMLSDPSDTSSGIRKALAEIEKDLNNRKASVFILGRYRHEIPRDMSQMKRDFERLNISYFTVHTAKGLEADFVIIPSMNAGRLGFPCGINDDPILELVMASRDSFEYAEERRLFYVALTRAKKRVFLIADRTSPSVFITEIINGSYEVEIDNDEGFAAAVKCPKCKTGTLLIKEGKFGKFISCSNFPYCQEKGRLCPECSHGVIFKSPDKQCYLCSTEGCKFTAPACPVCESIMVQRLGPSGFFWGCSRYPECKGTRNIGE